MASHTRELNGFSPWQSPHPGPFSLGERGFRTPLLPQDSDGKVRAGPRAKAQRRKGPGRRWGLPSESPRTLMVNAVLVVETLRATSLPPHLFVLFVLFVVPARTLPSESPREKGPGDEGRRRDEETSLCPYWFLSSRLWDGIPS
jgi:hypothetical protein